MKPSQIKTECELIYTQIEKLQTRLFRLRSICKHLNTVINERLDVKICSDCGDTTYISPNWENLADINRKEI